MESGDRVMTRAFHRGTRLRAPKRPISDAVKLEYVKWFALEHQPDWVSGNADIVLHLYLFEGLEKAFDAAREFTEARERQRNAELLEALMSAGAHGVVHSRSPGRIPLTEEQMKELNKRGSLQVVMNPEPKDDPSIRDLFGGPNWRTHVARYFGFR